ncbi:UvrD-helicase domain-containing protein [Helicobacter sp. 11S02629-2]|uniref:ATP-dependent helicase n=1 Tax=Helicobacter sp. 11S02629-2 TaxID=1476195 RepID=UPI000BA7A9EC|nr:UvrD-helicase domain-containing protein [Helicobacter sp. 11S02629-2]PAF46010.1 hypothetical protein BKH40_00950 [Helicobacter sp. 11S02629-2]
MDILDSLNEAQRYAATHIDGALLIIAGAGSGKTKTITTRLAYMIDKAGIDPYNTLTLTFTNKAAREMRERALALIESKEKLDPLLCTFHKFGLIFLREYIESLDNKRNSSFVIIDSNDQKDIIKKINKEKLEDVRDFISTAKNKLLSPKELSLKHPLKARLYQDYEDYLAFNNLVDFDDLLLMPTLLLKEFDALRRAISERYKYIMVDEYQDTNLLQLELIKLLCSEHNNICVVGDDDQSIYEWRGALLENILNFQSDFDAKAIKLESNYRSKKEILELANNLIKHNQTRLNKILRPTIESKASITYSDAFSEYEEIEQVCKAIYELQSKGERLKDIAIIFRVNALSRVIEATLNRYKIKHKLIGLVRFYERAEIKDALAYFRLIINPNDNYSFLRAIISPKRGLGEKSLDSILEASKGLSVYQAYKEGLLDGHKSFAKLKEFFDFIESNFKLNLYEVSGNFKRSIKLISDKDISEEANSRRQNIDELLGLCKDMHELGFGLERFLDEISLTSSSDEDIYSDEVSVLNIHSSKGLEFKHVFLMGLNEGFLPVSEDNLEEERRLAYVAFTRAKEGLYLSSAKNRLHHGTRKQTPTSRFIKECKVKDLLGIKETLSYRDGVRFEGGSTGRFERSKEASLIQARTLTGLKRNDILKHAVLGIGVVESVESDAFKISLKINFSGKIREFSYALDPSFITVALDSGLEGDIKDITKLLKKEGFLVEEEVDENTLVLLVKEGFKDSALRTLSHLEDKPKVLVYEGLSTLKSSIVTLILESKIARVFSKV